MAFPLSGGVGALPSALRGGVRRHEGSSERKVRTIPPSSRAWSEALNSHEYERALKSGDADALQQKTWLTELLMLHPCAHPFFRNSGSVSPRVESLAITASVEP